MANKRVSQFTVVDKLSSDDIFLINQKGTTSTVALSTLKNEIANNSQFSLGDANDGQYPRYDASVNKWKPADFPSIGTTTTNNVFTVKEPAKGLSRLLQNHYGYAFFTDYGVYRMGYDKLVGGSGSSYLPKPVKIPFYGNYLKNNPTVKPIKCTFNLLSVFVLLSDGTLWGCGYASYWQSGQPVPAGRTSSTFLPLNTGVLANKTIVDFSINDTSGSDSHTIGVICSDNTAYVWGYNAWGQLGNGTTTASNTPIQVNVPGKTPAQISVGGYIASAGINVLVRMTDGTLYGAGHNAYKILGTGNNTNQNTFVQAKENATTNLSNVAEIIEFHGMNMGYTRFIKKTDGTLWGIGLNNIGQLGIGNTTDQPYYTKVTLPTGVSVKKLVGCGWTSNTAMCLLDTNGLVYTWGNSSYGTTGQGSATHISTPTRVQVYQKTMTSTEALPIIKDIYGTNSGNNGTFGLITENGDLFTAGVYTFNALSIMNTDTTHTDTYYRFEKRNDVDDVEEVIFYDNCETSGGGFSVGAITRNKYGVLKGWGIGAAQVLGIYEGHYIDVAVQLNY